MPVKLDLGASTHPHSNPLIPANAGTQITKRLRERNGPQKGLPPDFETYDLGPGIRRDERSVD